MKSLEFFKPTLALNVGLYRSFRPAVAGKPPGERNVCMYDSIQLSKRASFRATSRVTWPNDNKAVGNCFQALIAVLRPASLILARRIAFPLVLLGGGLGLIQPCAGQSGWTATGSLGTRRYVHTATLLPNGKVLVTAGYSSSGDLASAELYDPATGTWTATGSLGTARGLHTATLLLNGKVLVAGGVGNSGDLASAELYDPASGTWTATGSLNTARDSHTATLLPDGNVLVAGGLNSPGDLVSAELYDPASGTWTATGSLGTARRDHTATLLRDGKVLVAGGLDSSNFPTRSAELYNPASGTWTGTGSLNTARAYGGTATLLPSGKVLVAGGSIVSEILAGAELYDPLSGSWGATRSLGTGRYEHTATLLPDGKVLVAGGFGTSIPRPLASAELYVPVSGTWSATGSLRTARQFHTATLLPNGNVLVAGGIGSSSDLASAELYVPPPPPITGPPVAITNPATLIASFSAKLNGSVNPHGLTTSVYFQYGTTNSYGLTTAPHSHIGNTSLNLSANISGLTASTTYHFRIVTSNSAGTRYGSDTTFTTLPPTGFPIVTTRPATNVSGSSATLTGLLDPHGLTTTVYFQYGTTTSYGRTTAVQSHTGNTFRNIAANAGGLASNTTYHFRIVATNTVGTRYGSDRTFTTQ
jgi:hypothetical protein